MRESEQKYRSFVKNFHGIAYQGGMNYKPSFFDGAVRQITGRAESEFLRGRLTWKQIIHPDDLKAFSESARDIRKIPNYSCVRDYRIIRKDGGVRWVREYVRKLTGKSGKPSMVQGTIYDITAQKTTEADLKESEEKFRTLAEESPNQIFINVQGHLVYVNKKCEEIMGYSRKEFYSPNFSILQLMVPEDREQVSHNIHLLFNYINLPPWEFGIVTKDGRRLNVIISTNLVKYGGEDAILGIITDITDKKKVEEKLRMERDRAQKYLDIAGVMIVVLGDDEKVSLINKRGCEILGYPENEVVGKRWFDNFIPDRYRCNVKAVFKDVLAGKTAVEYFENPVLTKSGEERLIAWRNSVMTDEKGGIVSTLSSGEDITESRRMEDEIKRQVEELRKLDEAKTEFISIAGHELRSPVQSVMLAADILDDEQGLTEHQKKYLGVIKRETFRLRGLINNILDLSAIDLGKMEFDMREISLSELVESLREEKLLKAKEKGLRMTFDIPSNLPSVRGDWDRLTQVLVNIIGNAIKFTPEDGSIDVSAMASKTEVVVCVSDTGVGIPKELHKKVFSRFFQTRPMVGRRNGFGLGLAISSEIVKAHGGRIWCESVEGKGSKFYFSIPRKR